MRVAYEVPSEALYDEQGSYYTLIMPLLEAVRESGLQQEIRYVPGWEKAYFIAKTPGADLWLTMHMPREARRLRHVT